jgi:hypothetical protein
MHERSGLRVARSVAVDEQHQQLESTTTPNHFAIQSIKAVLAVKDLVELLQIDRRTIERMRSAGTLPAPDLLLGTIGKKGKPRHPRWRGETIVEWLKRGGK